MRVVTIATGEHHARFAVVTVPLIRHCLGMDVDVIQDAPDPYLAKLSLPLDEPIMFVDCDIVFRQRIDLREIGLAVSRGEFAAPRFRWRPELLRKVKPGVDTETFQTSAWFAAGPRHAEAFALARELYAGEMVGAMYRDEQPLNAALTKIGVARHYLPGPRLMVGPTAGRPEDIARHYTSWNEPRLRYRRLAKAAVDAWRNLGEPLPQDLFRAVRALGIGGPAPTPIRPPNL